MRLMIWHGTGMIRVDGVRLKEQTINQDVLRFTPLAQATAVFEVLGDQVESVWRRYGV